MVGQDKGQDPNSQKNHRSDDKHGTNFPTPALGYQGRQNQAAEGIKNPRGANGQPHPQAEPGRDEGLHSLILTPTAAAMAGSKVNSKSRLWKIPRNTAVKNRKTTKGHTSMVAAPIMLEERRRYISSRPQEVCDTIRMEPLAAKKKTQPIMAGGVLRLLLRAR
jgi:hypothetical protein